MVKLRGEDIYDIPVPNAPAPVRVRTTQGLRRATARTDDAIFEMTNQMALLQERKRSLITAAVTGEFDVSTAFGGGL
jgi:type I restriction enzyme S subunit